MKKLVNILRNVRNKLRGSKNSLLVDAFDKVWYLEKLGDEAGAIKDPLDHYLNQGGYLTRDPNSVFDTKWYLRQHPELIAEKKNPLIHYLDVGERLGYSPSPDFDTEWYLRANPDVAAAGLSPLIHYLKFGKKEGRRATESAVPVFRSVEKLTKFIGELPASLNSTGCAVDLPISSFSDAEKQDRSSGTIQSIYKANSNSCEGVDGPVAYPPPGAVMRANSVLLVAGTRYVMMQPDALIHNEEAYFFDAADTAVKYNSARLSKSCRGLELRVNARQAAWIESGINVMHEYEGNYFHFLAETVPRMVLVEEANIPVDVPLLITGALHPNIRAVFDCLNYRNRPVIFLESGTIYRVQDMYYPSDLTSVVDVYEGGANARQSGLDVSRIRQGVRICQRELALKTSGKKRRIFAGRGGHIRRLLNQPQIETKLVAMGFELVSTESLSLESQISIFREAEIIVGPTGAQITNIAWCEPGTKVIVLASDHPSHQLYLWELLGRVSGAHVEYLLGPRAYTRNDIYSVHDDYRIDVDSLIAMIGAITP